MDAEKTNIIRTLEGQLTTRKNEILEEKKKTEALKQQLEETAGNIFLNDCYEYLLERLNKEHVELTRQIQHAEARQKELTQVASERDILKSIIISAYPRI